MKKIIILIIGLVLNFTSYYQSQNNVTYNNEVIIESIGLKQIIVSYKYSSINKNIILLKESDYINDLYFLAAHSGNSKISFFKNLDLININDKVTLIINNRKIKYLVAKKYYIKKNGYMNLEKEEKDLLYLITCDKRDKNQQLIVKCVKCVQIKLKK